MSFENAFIFACKKHREQTYQGMPYIAHLAHTVSILEEYRADDATCQAGWLHDTLEDTNSSREELASIFGHTVADLVWAVTDEPGKNRRQRKAKTYQKIQGYPFRKEATLLKLADRIANVEVCRTGPQNIPKGRLFLMYQGEHPDFYEALHREGEHEALWKRLNDLLGYVP